MGEKCASINPVEASRSRTVRCQLAVGHDGKHKAKRVEGDWTSTTYWEKDETDDETKALRKVAQKAAAYLDVSSARDGHWVQELELNNALAALRNLQRRPKKTDESQRQSQPEKKR